MDLILPKGEIVLRTWVLYMYLQDGTKYNGEFIVTNRNVFFDAQFQMGTSGVKAFDGVMNIPRENIIEMKSFTKSLIIKRFTLKTADEQIYTFDRGIFSVKPILNLLGFGK
jgi:hypothetical protein